VSDDIRIHLIVIYSTHNGDDAPQNYNDHKLPPSAEVKNAWNFNSMDAFTLMACKGAN